MSNYRKTEYKKTAVAVVKFALPTVVLVIAIVACFISLAWFSMSRTVTTNGMLVVPKEITLATYNGDEAFKVVDDIDNITSHTQDGNSITIPGTSAVYKVTLKNESDDTVTISDFGFAAPVTLKNDAATIESYYGSDYETVKEFEEFPRIKRSGTEGNYTYNAYYFGTQLYARVVKISILTEGHNDGDDVQYGNSDLYFYSSPLNIVNSDGTIDENAFRPYQRLLEDDAPSNPEEIPDLLLYGPRLYSVFNEGQSYNDPVPVPPNCVVIFYVQIKFANYEVSQNDYRGFAFNGGNVENYLTERCSRSIYINFLNAGSETTAGASETTAP